MRWDDKLTIPTATVDADPIAAPATVPAARTFRIQDRESADDLLNNRLIFGLHAPAVEAVSFELYALDDADDTVAVANREWNLVCQVAALTGGAVVQTSLNNINQGFIGNGLFYLRIVTNTLTANRELLIRATV